MIVRPVALYPIHMSSSSGWRRPLHGWRVGHSVWSEGGDVIGRGGCFQHRQRPADGESPQPHHLIDLPTPSQRLLLHNTSLCWCIGNVVRDPSERSSGASKIHLHGVCVGSKIQRYEATVTGPPVTTGTVAPKPVSSSRNTHVIGTYIPTWLHLSSASRKTPAPRFSFALLVFLLVTSSFSPPPSLLSIPSSRCC